MKKVGNLLHTCGRTAKTLGNLLRTCGRTIKSVENPLLPQVCDLKPKINPLLPVRKVKRQVFFLHRTQVHINVRIESGVAEHAINAHSARFSEKMMMMMEGNGQMLTETENAEQLRVNKYFFALFVFTLIFVVVLYKMIGFAYTDELCSLFLFFLFFLAMTKIHRWHFNKAFLVTLFVFFFYTCYSLWIGSNTPRGIANDAIIQIKPYLGFFCVYQLKPVFNESRKRILGDVCLLFWFIFLLPVGLVSLVNEKIFTVLLEHPAYYGIAVTIVSLCYLYCSRFTRRDKVVFLLMLSIGLLCGRSKFYGFFALSVFMMFFFSNIAHLKLNFRNVVILLCMFAAVIYVAWGKISLYFYQVLSDEMDKDLVARFVLYRTMPEVLHDYFPFGSGFASFGTYSSGQYYSDLYAQYGIEYIYGLSKAYHDFISDTFYPSLAQFGAAGIVLFVLFWIYILKRAFMNYRKSPDIKLLQIAILIVCFLGIENTTGSTFTAQGGFFVMMLMGVVLSERRRDAGQTVISEHGG